MPVISIPTSYNIDVEFEVPGFGRRLAALCIDILLQICYLILAEKILSLAQVSFSFLSSDAPHNLWAIQLISMVPVFVYHILMEITTNGQSPGKRLMNIRVVNINGGRASISQFVIRWLLRVSDLWLSIILYLLLYVMSGQANYEAIMIFLLGAGFLITDVIMILASKKAQRVGDILANTILIKTTGSHSLDSTVFREVEAEYVPVFLQVMRISDKDLNMVKSILDNSRKTGNYTMARSAADKIKNYLQVESDMEPEDFLDRLLKDYNYLSAK